MSLLLLLLCLCLFPTQLRADAPLLISQQGRIAVNGVNFDGTGFFKFALVNADASEVFWTNDGGELIGPNLQPEASVDVDVTKGHYSVTLGKGEIDPIPADVFEAHSEIYLRIWFHAEKQDSLEYEHLTPDRRLTSTPYALHATQAASAATATNADFAGNAHTANVATVATFALGIGGSDEDGSVMDFYGQSTLFKGSIFAGPDSNALPNGSGPGIRLFYDDHPTRGEGQIFAYDYGEQAPLDLKLQSPGGNTYFEGGDKIFRGGPTTFESDVLIPDSNVGIGTSPTERLDVNGNIKGHTLIGNQANIPGEVNCGRLTAAGIFSAPHATVTLASIDTAIINDTIVVAGSATIAGTATITTAVIDGEMKCQTAVITSDRNKKSGFEVINPGEILEKVASMPITNWHYKTNTGTRHIGPMAQDFHAAFGVGRDDKHISTVDADGVALAAIQALKSMVDQKDERIEALERRLETLETKLGQ